MARTTAAQQEIQRRLLAATARNPQRTDWARDMAAAFRTRVATGWVAPSYTSEGHAYTSDTIPLPNKCVNYLQGWQPAIRAAHYRVAAYRGENQYDWAWRSQACKDRYDVRTY